MPRSRLCTSREFGAANAQPLGDFRVRVTVGVLGLRLRPAYI